MNETSARPVVEAQTVSSTVAPIPTVSSKTFDEKQDSPWAKSKYANLYRYEPSGIYFARAKVCGRLIRRSLKTRSLEIAKNKLDRMLLDERGRLSLKSDEDLLFSDLADKYIRGLESNPDRKEGARAYRRTTLASLRRTWPKIDAMKPQEFTERAILDWAEKFRQQVSPTFYNGVIQTLRAVLQVAVDRGILFQNPAAGRKRNSVRGIPMARVPQKQLTLPEMNKFKALLARLDALPSRNRAAHMVRFLAYSGARIGAVREITPQNIDLARNEIVLPQIKYDLQPNRIPMVDEMRALAEELLRTYPGSGPLIPIKNPRRALRHACREAGIEPALTNHNLRDLFATRCIESGIDIFTVAKWLGHKDGGKTLLRTYAHLRNEHSQAMAKKVSFLPA